MASKKRKIRIFDEHGLLTRRALLAFANNELPPDAQEQVGKIIEDDEMYRDALEGLKQIPERETATSAIHSLNENIAARSGAEAAGAGGGFHVPEFFMEYRKMAAAIIGVLIVAAAIVTVSLLQNEKASVAIQQQKEDVRDKFEEKTTVGKEAEQKSREANGDADADEPNETFIDDVEEDVGILEKTEIPVPKKSKEESTPKVMEAPNEDFAGVGQNQKSAAAPPAAIEHEAEMSNGFARQKAADIESRSITNLAEQSAADDYVAGNVFSEAEVMPEFPGGDAALRQYIRDNMNLSKRQQKKIADAKVYVSFVVDAGGNVKDVRVVKGADKTANAEAMKIISSMPKWNPGMQNGEPVAVKQYLTIDFGNK